MVRGYQKPTYTYSPQAKSTKILSKVWGRGSGQNPFLPNPRQSPHLLPMRLRDTPPSHRQSPNESPRLPRGVSPWLEQPPCCDR